MGVEIHVGDVLTAFKATVKDQNGAIVDISTATTKQLIFKKTDGTIVAKAAAFVTDGVDGQMQYISAANDLDQSGTWHVQGYVVLASGGAWHTDVHTFVVDPNLS